MLGTSQEKCLKMGCVWAGVQMTDADSVSVAAVLHGPARLLRVALSWAMRDCHNDRALQRLCHSSQTCDKAKLTQLRDGTLLLSSSCVLRLQLQGRIGSL